MNLYDVLGVDKKADGSAIKRAFRRRAQKAHPDRGGSDAEMAAVNRAYGVLSDLTARERYDQHGEEPEQDPHAAMLNELGKLIFGIIEAAVNPTACDILDMARGAIKGVIEKNEQGAENYARSAGKLKRAAARLKRKRKGGEDMVLAMLRFRADEYEKGAAVMLRNNDYQRQMLELLAEYEYAWDQPPPPIQMYGTAQIASVFGGGMQNQR